VEKQKQKGSGKKRRLRFLLPLVLLAVVAVAYAFHGPLLERGVRAGLSSLARSGGLHFEAGKISIRLGQTMIFEDVSVRANEPWTSSTEAKIGRVEVALSGIFQLFGPRGRLLSRIALRDGWVFVDVRDQTRAPAHEPMRRLDSATKRRDADRLQWLLPQRVVLERIHGEVRSATGGFLVESLTADFNEAKLGTFAASGMDLTFGETRQVFAAQRGITAWKAGTLFLAELTIRQGIQIDNLAIQLAGPGGIGMDLEGRVFGGLVRGGAFFGEWRGEPGVDAAVWASGVQFRDLFQFFGIDGRATGSLNEGRFTFRGNPSRPIDAEASLRLSADDFRWGERGWQRLEAAASLINRSLVVTELKLQQEENSLTANGEIALSGDWKDAARSPFLLNISASIRDMGSLAALLGPPFDEMTGRMSLSAALSGLASKPEGFLAVEASDVALRGRSVESSRLDVLFAGGEARVQRIEIWSDRDRFAGSGSIGLVSPHEYSGQLEARVEDVGAYAWLGAEPLPVAGGRVQFQWQGDGNHNAHSGAFTAAVEDLISEQTPEGVSGRFSATYSPGNIYFGGFELVRGPLALALRATLAESGIKIQDATLKSGGRQLAGAEAFLPLNPFAVAGGATFAAAAIPDKSLYASLRSNGELAIEELLALAGRDSPLKGRIRAEVEASGKLDAIEAKAVIRGRDLIPASGASAPASELDLSVSAGQGVAVAGGTLTPKGLPPLRLDARLPFGLVVDSRGQPRWVSSDGPISGRLLLPGTELSIFRVFAPDLHRLNGILSGSADLSGTLAAPVFSGQLDLRGGEIQFSPRSPLIDKVEAGITMGGTDLRVGKISGELAAGPFEISGNVSLEEISNPRYDLALKGSQLLLHRSSDARLRADADLSARGDNAGGKLSGSVRLVDGRVFKRIEITPFIAPSPEQKERPFVAPTFEGLVPPPFALWDLDVTIANATPFEIVGNIASGTIVPELRLGGTLGRPVPTGTVSVQGARAYLPFTTMDIPEGEIRFFANDPWMPYLEVRGTAEAQEYDIFLHAYGALRDRNLMLRSDPPLSQEALIVLLGTGFAPGYFSGAGFGEAAAGQGGLLLLRSLLRQFNIKGVDTEGVINRLQISSAPPRLPGDRSTLRGRLRVWRGLSVTTAQDEMGYWNMGVSYRFRFR